MTILSHSKSSFGKTDENKNSSKRYTKKQWKETIVNENTTLKYAIARLEHAALQILIVVDEEKKFIGTITDGDIRRGLLKGFELDASIYSLVNRNAFVVPNSMGNDIIFKIMAANGIRQIPIVDDNHCVIGLHTWDDINSNQVLTNPMVIMAGGIGKRLHPYTENCPKPMLPVYGKPIIEHILMKAIAEGFSKFFISVNYLGHMIEDYFGDGRNLGVDIEYIRETKPLGTAGALFFLKSKINCPFIVTNGDVLTHMKYSELLEFHIAQKSEATMAVRMHKWESPFGVVDINGLDIVGLKEKPVKHYHINAGVYCLNSSIFSYLENEGTIDMTDLFVKVGEKSQRKIAYPMHESWVDVGRPEDYKSAASHFE